METATKEITVGVVVPTTHSDDKDTTNKLPQNGGVGSPRPFSIPVEFIDTPSLVQPTSTAVYTPPSSVTRQAPVTYTVLSEGGGYLGSSAPQPLTVTGPMAQFAPSSTAYEFVSGRQPVNWGTSSYTVPKTIESSMEDPGFKSFHRTVESALPATGVAGAQYAHYTTCVDDPYSSCRLELPSRNTVGYRLLDPASPEASTTVTRYRLPRSHVTKVLPMKEVEYCTEAHEGRSRMALQPSVTTYIIPSTKKPAKRRNVILGRSRGICQDWVIPCLDTLFTAISRACNCDVDIFPPPDHGSSMEGYAYQPATGDAICLSCGETVDYRMLSGKPLPYRANRPWLTKTKKEPERDGLIPLPTFAFNSLREAPQPIEERAHSDPTKRAAKLGKRKSSALGYPTDDDGMVALPAFTLNDGK